MQRADDPRFRTGNREIREPARISEPLLIHLVGEGIWRSHRLALALVFGGWGGDPQFIPTRILGGCGFDFWRIEIL